MHIILSKKEYEELLAYKAKFLNDKHKHIKYIEANYLFGSINTYESASGLSVTEEFREGWQAARRLK